MLLEQPKWLCVAARERVEQRTSPRIGERAEDGSEVCVGYHGANLVTIRSHVNAGSFTLVVGDETRSGGCLCGSVRYEVRGPLRDVLFCHCVECRRWHGHVCAATAAWRDDLVLREQRGLRWIDSPASDSHAARGFCGECGSSLFWRAPERETVSIAAGTLDDASGLSAAGHIYVSQAGDYYAIADDLPRFERGAPAELSAVPGNQKRAPARGGEREQEQPDRSERDRRAGGEARVVADLDPDH